jgi:N utilization substance protein A
MNLEINFSSLLESLSNERNIPQDIIKEAVSKAISKAIKQDIGEGCQIEIIYEKNKLQVIRSWNIVSSRKKSLNHMTEITLQEAKKRFSNTSLKVNSLYKENLDLTMFGRTATYLGRETISQALLYAKSQSLLRELIKIKHRIIQGIVSHVGPNTISVELNQYDITHIVKKSDLLDTDRYQLNDIIKLCLVDVKIDQQGKCQLVLSRSHPKMLEALMYEIPEINEGKIKIINIVRYKNIRSKVAVHSNIVDPCGICIGVRGMRIQLISKELNEEKIDIIQWDENIITYSLNALACSIQIKEVFYDQESDTLSFIVPKEHIAQVIGTRGINIYLAHKLTGCKLKIINSEEYQKISEEKNQVIIQNLQNQFGFTLAQCQSFLAEGIKDIVDLIISFKKIVQICQLNEKEQKELFQKLEYSLLKSVSSHLQNNDALILHLCQLDSIDRSIAILFIKNHVHSIEEIANMSIKDIRKQIQITEEIASNIIIDARKYQLGKTKNNDKRNNKHSS